MLTIYILTENTAGGKFLAEHGLSYLIEIDNEKILFDTGHSDVFLQNAQKLGINIIDVVKKVVLSHGHWDHGNGLLHLDQKTLITHPESFSRRFRMKDKTNVGLVLSKEELNQRYSIVETDSYYKITNNLFFLGQIPRTNNFESTETTFEKEDGSSDYIMDDSALVAIINKELVIITGCSHSGICNICEFAKQKTGIDKIKAVIGGFHLKTQNQQTQMTVNYFKENKIETLYPSHCTDLPALSLFYNKFGIKQLKTGMKLVFQ